MDVNHRRGYAWSRALPKGYETTIAGLIVFLAGGILDMIKHTLWGFEQGFDALLSPTHLLIGAGMFLIIAGPVRSAFERARPPATLVGQLPMLLALASMMELMHWGLQFIFLSEAEHMNAPLDPARFPHDTFTLLSLLYYKQGIGLMAVTIQSLLVVGFALYAARRISLAPGALTRAVRRRQPLHCGGTLELRWPICRRRRWRASARARTAMRYALMPAARRGAGTSSPSASPRSIGPCCSACSPSRWAASGGRRMSFPARSSLPVSPGSSSTRLCIKNKARRREASGFDVVSRALWPVMDPLPGPY